MTGEILRHSTDFHDFRILHFLSIFEFLGWDLGSGRVCNGLEMAVGFKWTDSQFISSHVGPFSTIFVIFVIFGSFSKVCRSSRKVPGPSETVLKVPRPDDMLQGGVATSPGWVPTSPNLSRVGPNLSQPLPTSRGPMVGVESL